MLTRTENTGPMSNRRACLFFTLFAIGLSLFVFGTFAAAILGSLFGDQISKLLGGKDPSNNSSSPENASGSSEDNLGDSNPSRALLGVSIAQDVLKESLSFAQLTQVFLLLLIGVQAFSLLPGRGIGGKLDTFCKLFTNPGSLKCERDERQKLELQ